MTQSPEQIHTAEQPTKTRILESREGAILERQILGSETVPLVIARGEEDLFDNDLMLAEKNIYGLSNDVMLADANINSANVEAVPAQKVANRLQSDYEKGGDGAVVVNALDGLAYRSVEGGDYRVIVTGPDGVNILNDTGTLSPDKDELVFIVADVVAQIASESAERYDQENLIASLESAGLPFIAVEVHEELAQRYREESSKLHQRRIKSRADRPQRKSADMVTQAADMVDSEESTQSNDAIVIDTSPDTSHSVDKAAPAAVAVDTAKAPTSEPEARPEEIAESSRPHGKRLRTAYEVAEDRYQNDREEAFANAKAPAVYFGPNMYQGPEDEPELRKAIADEERGFSITDRRKKLYSQEVTRIKLTENGVDLDVAKTEPITEVLDVVDITEDRAVVGAEQKLANLRQQIDKARNETGFSKDRKLSDLTKEYLEQNSRLRSLKEGKPYVGKHIEAPEVRSLSKRAQEMYTRAGVDLSTQLFMLNERLPRPQQRKNETEAAYDKRVEKYRQRVLGAGVLAVYGLAASGMSASFTGVEVSAAPLTTGRRI